MSAAVPFTPEERDAWRANQKRKVRNTVLYGWRLTPVFREAPKPTVEITDAQAAEPELIGWARQFTHPPGTLLAAAAKRSRKVRQTRNEAARLKREEEASGTFYIVWSDRSLRKIDNAAYQSLGKVPADKREAALNSTLNSPQLAQAA